MPSDWPKEGWSLFSHDADLGVRGTGSTREAAFEQAALALSAGVTDLSLIEPRMAVAIECEAPSDKLLFVDWLNAVIYEMAVRKMLFSRYAVAIEGNLLHAEARGEPVDRHRHAPAVEPKGATYTELEVRQQHDGRWIAQCVVDV